MNTNRNMAFGRWCWRRSAVRRRPRRAALEDDGRSLEASPDATVVTSDKLTFDYIKKFALFENNVVVNDPRLQLSCRPPDGHLHRGWRRADDQGRGQGAADAGRQESAVGRGDLRRALGPDRAGGRAAPGDAGAEHPRRARSSPSGATSSGWNASRAPGWWSIRRTTGAEMLFSRSSRNAACRGGEFRVNCDLS